MDDWIKALPENRQRGSYPRCLLYMNDNKSALTEKLTKLIGVDNVEIPSDFKYAPQGIPRKDINGNWDKTPTLEAKLGESSNLVPASNIRKTVSDWWLAVKKGANTPNWDIACTCTVNGKDGLLLVEAKAHDSELHTGGKKLASDATLNSFKNHIQIGEAVSEASAHLQRATGWDWAISRDKCYQLSNRFAWAWKLASLKIPVVLLYLGFLNAEEMHDCGKPFVDHHAWKEVVLEHSSGIAPEQAWDTIIDVEGIPIITGIRSETVFL